jgi:CysZ protein
MIGAAFGAARDIFSRAFRAVLWKSLGLTILLFASLFFAVQFALSYLQFARLTWLEPAIAIIAGLGLVAAFIVLLPSVTAMFAGLFLDQIAALVERTHYPEDAPGRPLPAMVSLMTALRFALLVLLVNLIALPFLLIGIGALAMLIANAYLLSREFFEMISLRHLPRREAEKLRQKHSYEVFLAGFIPAALMLLPLANLFVPVFSTSYFTHLFKSIAHAEVRASSVDKGRDPG